MIPIIIGWPMSSLAVFIVSPARCAADLHPFRL
jgi:hypothetical protein